MFSKIVEFLGIGITYFDDKCMFRIGFNIKHYYYALMRIYGADVFA